MRSLYIVTSFVTKLILVIASFFSWYAVGQAVLHLSTVGAMMTGIAGLLAAFIFFYVLYFEVTVKRGY